MNLSSLYEILDTISPFELCEEWDNCGILVGEPEMEIENIYLSLDLDYELVSLAKSNSVFIVHHPLIFKGLKKLNFAKYPSNIIEKLIQKKCALIAMHTNFDKTHLNDYVLNNILGYNTSVKNGFISYFDVNLSFEDFVSDIKKKLNLDVVRAVKSSDHIKTAAIITGSGFDLLASVRADCFLSGDLKYHSTFEAKENKISILDIGHYESEVYFAECLAKNLKNLPLKAIISNSKNPFSYF